jgi:hypothetical protein
VASWEPLESVACSRIQPFQRASPNPSGPPDFTSRVDRSLGPACHQPDHYVVCSQAHYSIVKYPCAFGAIASRLRRSSRLCRATTKIIRAASVCPRWRATSSTQSGDRKPPPKGGTTNGTPFLSGAVAVTHPLREREPHNAPSCIDGNAAGKYSPSIKKIFCGSLPAVSDARPFSIYEEIGEKLH